MPGWDGAAFDRWLTTDPREAQVCPCGDDCDWVETDCGHVLPRCETTWDVVGDDRYLVCRVGCGSHYEDDSCHCGHPDCGAC